MVRLRERAGDRGTVVRLRESRGQGNSGKAEREQGTGEQW